MMRLALIGIAAFACTVHFALAAEISVPADYATIQSAIDAASDGDTVVVYPGVYPDDFTFYGKAITVRSTNPSDIAVVTATEIRGAVRFEDDEKHSTILAGLTIAGKLARVTCLGGSPLVRNNRFVGSGGIGTDASPRIVDNLFTLTERNAIVCYGSESSPVISGNCFFNNSPIRAMPAVASLSQYAVIVGNTFAGNYGTAIGIYRMFVDGDYTAATVVDNVIDGNGRTGIYAEAWSGVAQGNTFLNCAYCIDARDSFMTVTGNTMSGSLNGIYLRLPGAATVQNNVITGNSGLGIYAMEVDCVVVGNIISANMGAGILLNNCVAEIADNRIIGNSGGGIGMSTSASGNISGNVIAGNTSASGGGGIQLGVGRRITLSNNTVIGNKALRGGGVQLSSDCRAPMRNCIVRGNRAGTGSQICVKELAALSVAGCNVEGGEGAVSVGPYATLTWGTGGSESGNIDADPLFVDPGHWDDAGTPDDESDDFFVLGDYRLLPGSPCIDAGTNNIDNPDTPEVETLPAKDIAGVTRVIDGNRDGTATVDIGAYEYLPGDVDHDGRVTILDLIRIRNALGLNPASDPAARLFDLNCDGRVDVLDLILARYVMQGR